MEAINVSIVFFTQLLVHSFCPPECICVHVLFKFNYEKFTGHSLPYHSTAVLIKCRSSNILQFICRTKKAVAHLPYKEISCLATYSFLTSTRLVAKNVFARHQGNARTIHLHHDNYKLHPHIFPCPQFGACQAEMVNRASSTIKTRFGIFWFPFAS